MVPNEVQDADMAQLAMGFHESLVSKKPVILHFNLSTFPPFLEQADNKCQDYRWCEVLLPI